MGNTAIIAIVDDDPSVGRAIGRLVQSAGMEARGYRSAEDFLAALADGEPDCALLDVQMPGGSGLALQERLRRFGSRMPILFMTAYDSEDVRAQALRGGALACLRKPLGEVALLAAIARALAQKPGGEPAPAGPPEERHIVE